MPIWCSNALEKVKGVAVAEVAGDFVHCPRRAAWLLIPCGDEVDIPVVEILWAFYLYRNCLRYAPGV